MNPDATPEILASDKSGCQAADIPMVRLAVQAYESASTAAQSSMLTQLIGEVYASAPAVVRSHLLAHLLRPLGVLSLVAVANGIFANIWFRSGGQDMPVRLEDMQNVRVSDVVALVDHVQQVSVDAVNGLAQMLGATSVMTGSVATAVLVTVLVQRARTRRVGDHEVGSSSATPA